MVAEVLLQRLGCLYLEQMTEQFAERVELDNSLPAKLVRVSELVECLGDMSDLVEVLVSD